MSAQAVPGQVQAIVLDDASLAVARAAARPPWFARGVTGILLVAAPILLSFEAAYAGQGPVTSSAADVLTFFFSLCLLPFLLIPWFVAFLVYRFRGLYLRESISLRRAWMVSGQVQQVGPRTITVYGRPLRAVHRVRIPDWARAQTCTVAFADPGWGMRGVVIWIETQSGRRIYPEIGPIPDLLKAPAVIASALASLTFTAACTAQSQGYSDAAARLRDIQAATQCSDTSKPGDDCWRWVPGTLEWGGSYSESPGSSKCPVTLRWTGGRQDGDIRGPAGCSQQLSATGAMQVTIQVLRSYAIQVKVGEVVYQTDRWAPDGGTVFVLEWIFRLAALLWLAWPIFHIASAVLYRLRRVTSTRRAGTPSPPAPVPGSAT